MWYLGSVSRKHAERAWPFARKACVHAEALHAKGLRVDEGTAEADTTRTLAGRREADATQHRGRILGIVQRKTGRTGYTQLPNKVPRSILPTTLHRVVLLSSCSPSNRSHTQRRKYAARVGGGGRGPVEAGGGA